MPSQRTTIAASAAQVPAQAVPGAEGSIVVATVREGMKEGKSAGFGFNAQTDKYEDLVKAGVIDPTKVVRYALQNVP